MEHKGGFPGRCADRMPTIFAVVGSVVSMWKRLSGSAVRRAASWQAGDPGGSSGSGAKTANAPASSASAMHPECTQRGADSQKIVWARENGETEEKMSAAESSPARKKLVADVYRVRGSAPQVRTRIETECNAEMAEKAKVIALHESMVRAGVLPAQKAAPAGPSAAEKEAEAARQSQIVAQNDAAETKRKCDRLQASMESILGQQRRGGSATHMDNLNRQRAAVDRDTEALGCSRLK